MKMNRKLFYPLLLVVGIVIPLFTESDYFMHTLIMAAIYSLLTMGLNIISGFAGQLSLGHAAFFGVGAYTAALLTLRVGLNFYLAMACSAGFAGIIGVLLGFPALKLRGPYLVICSIGFVQIMHEIFLNWASLTRGPMGIVGIEYPPSLELGQWTIDFSIPINYYFLVLFFVAVTFCIILALYHSKTGRALKAIREDEIAAECAGINLTRYKLIAFTTGAFFAGVAGSLYAHYIGYVSPDSFMLLESINILVMLVLGGMGTILGPVVGAFGVTFLLEYLRFLAEFRLVFYGLVLMVVIVVAPGGFWGFVTRLGILPNGKER
jgi:branched-chain amino acid transport system permease protein